MSRVEVWTASFSRVLCLLVAWSAFQLAIPSMGFAQADNKESAGENPFPGRFPAPSLDGGTEWLNTSGPISLQDLRGKIVLLDFWTYCCINCIHVLPDLKYLEQKYPNELVVIGVHSAKFENEKESENIRDAIMRYEIEHPVLNDSNMAVARKYEFSSWPSFVVIDPEGNFVGKVAGEGNRELLDQVFTKMIAFHRAKKTLDETPVKFNLERAKVDPTPLRYPGKILADEAGGRLFITDSNHNRIVITSLDGELQSIIGNGSMGHDDGTYEEASFDHPQGVTLIGDTLYVADTENHMIRTVDLKAQTVSTLMGTGKQMQTRAPNGTPINIKSGSLNSPWALLEFKGYLYVAMAGPHQIWRHKLGSQTIVPFVGSGREDIIDGNLKNAALAQPSDIVTDGKFLYIVDSEGSAIRKIDVAGSGSVKTVVGPRDFPQGRSLFEFGDIDGKNEEVRMQHPIGCTFHNGKLYVVDTYNDKVKIVDPVEQTSETWLGTGNAGDGLDPVEMKEPAGLSAAGEFLFIADTNNHRVLKTNLSTKETVVLAIAGLTPPPPVAPKEQTFDGKSEELSGVKLAAGQPVTVTVAFELPAGDKLNQLAPVIYKLQSADGKAAFADGVLDQRHKAEKGDDTATFEFNLRDTATAGKLVVTVEYQYCSDGTGGLCRFGSQQFKVPFSTAADGVSVIELKAKP
ncbi:thioredoxin-like domain-containing protein [Planctomicrobium sp. SH668]|uniref:thioredoxin-like domain-containing protein n=1 Tax=Planctomicrobium sp. SH668 TaxID=3448126 RepID=UPI003F5B4C26